MKVLNITLQNLQQGGTTCANPVISWESPYCGDIRCINNDGTEVTLEVPDECEGECLWATISCPSECSTCEPQRIKVCPCDVSSDCEDCENCINNICVSKCPDGKVCVNGDCHTCDGTHPCPCNQVCQNGECSCPPEKPYKNMQGCCVDCRDNKDCPPCHICTENGCVPIDCNTGVCDPDTNNCVECNVSGDCDGENECCVGHKCNCCPGFVRNPITKKCELAPDCTTDTQCPDCFYCKNGVCVPVQCPDGHICVNGECVKECNCAAPDCPAGKSCIPTNNGKCYCSSCSGTCTGDENCGEGCYCYNGRCVPNPCYNKTCANGVDCGLGCGCDNGKCKPCDSLTCEECGTVVGCECVSGKCGKAGGCSGDCATSSDCGEGCTCHNGTCVSCKQFTCEQCGTKSGCACSNGACSGTDKNECQDVFELIKDDTNCDLIANLVKAEECDCPKVTVGSTLKEFNASNSQYQNIPGVTKTQKSYRAKFDLILRKGSVASANSLNAIPRLSDTTNPIIADNEMPTAGIIELTATTFWKEVDNKGRVVGVTAGNPYVESGAYAGTDIHTFTVDIEEYGNKRSQYVSVDRVEVSVVNKVKFDTPNGCDYKATTIATYTFGGSTQFADIAAGVVNKDTFSQFAVMSSDNKRNPMFTWYKDKNGVFSDDKVFRKLYIPKTNSKYTDTLRGMGKIDPSGKYPLTGTEGQLWSGYDYLVKSDCGCKKATSYSNLVFCNPKTLAYDLSECQTKITLKAPFEPCDMNQDINIWKSAGNHIPDDAQVKYALYLNGVKVATFKHDKNLGMVKDGTNDSMFASYTSATPITKIELKNVLAKTETCTIKYDVEPVTTYTFSGTKNCTIQGDSYTITYPKVVSEPNNSYTITSITGPGITVADVSGNFVVTLKKNVSTALVFSTVGGCKQTVVVNEDCCSAMAATIALASEVLCDQPIEFTTSVTSGQPPFTYSYTTPNGTKISGGSSMMFSSWLGGTYTVEITDKNGCKTTATTSVTKPDVPTISLSGYKTVVCEGDTNTIIVNGNSKMIEQELFYEKNGTVHSVVIGPNGTATIPNANTEATYDQFYVTIDGCTTFFADTVSITQIGTPTVTMPEDQTICAGENTFIRVIGTPGLQVTLNQGIGTITLPQSNDLTSYYDIPVNGLTSDKTYTILSANLGTCVAEIDDSSTTITVGQGTDIILISTTAGPYPMANLKFNVNPQQITLKYRNEPGADTQTNSGGLFDDCGSHFCFDVHTVQYSSITVTYDNGNCTVSETFPISQVPCNLITGTIQVQEGSIWSTLNNKTFCSSTATYATKVTGVGGGTGPYTYQWIGGGTNANVGPTINGSANGTYTTSVKVTDYEGCSTTLNATYTVYPKPDATIVLSKNGGAPNTVVGSIKSTTAVTITVNASDTNKFIMSAFTNPGGSAAATLIYDATSNDAGTTFLEIPADTFTAGYSDILYVEWLDSRGCTVQKSNITVNFV